MNNPYEDFSPYSDFEPVTESKKKKSDYSDISPVAAPPTIAQKAAPYVRMGLESAGLLGGGAAGLMAGGPLGAVIGGTTMGAAGELGANLYEEWAGVRKPPQNIQQAAGQTGGALARAGTAAMMGEVAPLMALPGMKYVGTSAAQKALRKVLGNEMGYWNEQEMEQLIRLSREHGIDLTAPEVTGSKTLQDIWHSISNTPGPAADKIQNWIKTIRNPQINEAIQNEMGRFGSEMSASRTGELAREGAQGIKAGLEAERSMVAGPSYKKAFEAKPEVDIAPALQTIDNLAAGYPSGTQGGKLLQRVRSLFTEGDAFITDLQKLQKIRREIGDMISQKRDWEGSPLNRENSMLLTKTKAALEKQMYLASEEYKAADRLFAEKSQPINELIYGDSRKLPREKKVKTIIGKLIELDTPQLDKAVDVVFKANPDEIAKTRQWFVNSGREDVWNQLTRGKLDQELSMLKKNVTNEELGKKGYNFKQNVFTDERDISKWKAALSNEDFRHLESFMKLLDRTEKLVYQNSKTAMMQDTREVIDAAAGGASGFAVNAAEKIATLVNLALHPLKTVKEVRKIMRPATSERLVDQLFNPEIKASLSEIAKMPPAEQYQEFVKVLGRLAGMELGMATSGW